MNDSNKNNQFEVFSPWAEADPIPLNGISPRVEDLEGKKIGLFVNNKRAAAPMQDVVEKRLKERYPSASFSRFIFGGNIEVSDTEEKENYERWLKTVDTVISAVGD